MNEKGKTETNKTRMTKLLPPWIRSNENKPNHQSSIINHQSSICNHQSAICNLQSAICNHQPSPHRRCSERTKPVREGGVIDGDKRLIVPL